MSTGGQARPFFPDGIYALWNGVLYEAQFAGNVDISLRVPADGPVPAGFNPGPPGQFSREVPLTDLSAHFSLSPHCVWQGEKFSVGPVSPDGVFGLTWWIMDYTLGPRLGLAQWDARSAWTGAAPWTAITATWLEYRTRGALATRLADIEFSSEPPPEWPVRSFGAGERDALIQRVLDAARASLPRGWAVLELHYRELGTQGELEWFVADGTGQRMLWSPPPEIPMHFTRLREGMYDEGVWTSAAFYLTPEDATTEFNTFDRPGFRRAATRAEGLLDLERYPREPVPGWLLELTRPSRERKYFWEVRIFDYVPRELPPVVDRPALAENEIAKTLRYLDEAPAFLVERGFGRDLIDGAEDVPLAYHTDGFHIWPADVSHYLRKYGIAPEPHLMETVRSERFQVPDPDPAVVAEAEYRVTGEEVVVPPPDARVTKREYELLELLRRRLDEYGVSPQAYALRSPVPERWSLYRDTSGWVVELFEDGEPRSTTLHERLDEAAAQLLGELLIDPARARKGAPEIRETRAVLEEWPIQPLPGEPPLTLFQGKRIVLLGAGTYLVRYGPGGGNLTFAEGTPFSAMSIRPERREQGPRGFRVQRPIYALTGTTIPWHDQPGGGTAYMLPLSVDRHVEAGALAEAAVRDSGVES